MADALITAVGEVLLKADPIQLYFPEYKNTDEYDSEAAEIASRLPACTSIEQCLDVVYAVFVDNVGEKIAGQRERYASVASQLWDLRSDDNQR